MDLIGKMASRLVAYENFARTLYGQESQRIETRACTAYQSYPYKFLVGVIASLVAIHMEAIRGLLNHGVMGIRCQVLRTYDQILYH